MYISVIMSTYNEPLDWVTKSVESILAQTHQFFEFIIVIDNPHYLELHELLDKYQKEDNRIVVLKNERNLGLVKSLNKAINQCRYDYIARMDADDIAKPYRLTKQLECLTKNKLDIVGGGITIIDEKENIIREFSSIPCVPKEVSKLISFKSIVYHPTWLVKKTVYNKLNGYRNIHAAEDFDFLLRANLLGLAIGNVDIVVLKYRVRSNSISNTNSFRQFLTSEFIKREHKKNKVANIEHLNKHLSLEMTNKNTIKYDETMKLLNNAVKFNQSGTSYRMIIYVCKALLKSKYAWIYLKDRIGYNFYSKIYSKGK